MKVGDVVTITTETPDGVDVKLENNTLVVKGYNSKEN